MSTKYWDKVEIASREEIKDIQSKRLIDTVKRVYNNVPYYRQRMDDAGVKPEDIRSVDDISKLPFTNKQDLRDNYPFGSFAVSMDEVVRIHASSGTTGKQTVVGYTKNDVFVWSQLAARCFNSIGASSKDLIHISYGYGLFTGGLGMHYGAEALGASVIPVSTGNTSRQLQLLKDFGTTVLCCTPSYALYLAESMKEKGYKLSDFSLQRGLFGAEAWTEEMRKQIETNLGIKAYDVYGLSEIMGPSVACECECQNGMHIWEDNFIPEIINPDTGEVLPYGEKGELVFTTITKEALPLIRYRTHDIASLIPDSCPCGRTHIRMTKPQGRSDDMLIIRGVNVFPSQIESVLLSMGNTSPHYLLIVDRIGNLDTLEVQVEMSQEMFSDAVRFIEKKELEIRKVLESTLGIACKVKLVEPKTLERSEGKSKHVIDRRSL